MLCSTLRMILEVSLETECYFLVDTVILGFLSIFKKSQASSSFVALNSTRLSSYQGMWGPLSRWAWDLWLSLQSPQVIQTSLHLLRRKTNLHSRHCREVWPSFESCYLGIHATWYSKLRVPLTYLFLREGSSLSACGKLAYFFNRILGIISLLETIWGNWSFPRAPVLKLLFL